MSTKRKAAFKFRKFSTRQKQLLTWWKPSSPYRDYDTIICEGSIRSGKTVAMILSFLLWSIHTFDGENFIFAAKSLGALKRNVITPLLKILCALGLEYEYVRSGPDPHLTIGTNTYYLFGANNEAAQDVLQGLTAAGAYLDDAGKMPWSFIEQADARCSVDAAKIWLNCNPEGPFHPIKAKLIDQAAEKRVLVLHFELDDNLTLSPATKARYRSRYAGVFYKRNILGLWAAAEGAIYDMLSDQPVEQGGHVARELPAITQYWVGVDYGTATVTAFWLLGLGADDRLYFIDFWRWDAVKKMRQKTDIEFAQELERWLAMLAIVPARIFVPEDAASFITQLQQAKASGQFPHIGPLAVADRTPGSVLRRIRTIASLLAMGRLRFAQGVKDKDGLQEWMGYVWEPKAQQRGEDAPLKENDHDPDAGGYAITGIPQVWRKWIPEAAA